jgi:hypothetical protein
VYPTEEVVPRTFVSPHSKSANTTLPATHFSLSPQLVHLYFIMEIDQPDGIEVIEISPQQIDIIWDDDKIEKVSLFVWWPTSHAII